MGFPTPTRAWGDGAPRDIIVNGRSYPRTPVSDDEFAAAADHYFGQDHDPLEEGDRNWLLGQIALDRYYAKGQHPWTP